MLFRSATLNACFEWVGILEDLDVSRRLLPLELPRFFRGLDTTADIVHRNPSAWRRDHVHESDRGGNGAAAAFVQRVYLRPERRLYQAQRARLQERARRLRPMH